MQWPRLLFLVRCSPSKLRKQRHWAESGGKKCIILLLCGFQRSYCTEIMCGWSIVDSQTPHPIRTFFDEMRAHPDHIPQIWSVGARILDHHACMNEPCGEYFSKNVFVFVKYSFLSIIFTCEWRVCIYDLAIMSIRLFSKWYTFFSRFRFLGST